jgi:hypothetical protein
MDNAVASSQVNEVETLIAVVYMIICQSIRAQKVATGDI